MVGNDSYTKLLIHSDTTDNSTVFIDSSVGGGHTISSSGNIHHETDQKVFGATSIQFDGSGVLILPNHTDFDFGTGDFAVDFWIRLNNSSTYQFILGCENVSGYMMIAFNNPSVGKLAIGRHNITWDFSVNHGMSSNVWYHIAITRESGVMYMFRGGTLLGSGSNTNNYYIGVPYIGSHAVGYPLVGYVDEFRISKGIARWTSAFTPPDKPYSALIMSFFDPVPTQSGTVYALQQLLKLTVTISGEYPPYVYDADFYNGIDDTPIGSTVSGINSGSQVISNNYFTTISAIDYSWYVIATSSGEDYTSPTYYFNKRFLCEGYTEVDGVRTSGIPVRLYKRLDGSFIGSTVTAGISGTFQIPTEYTDYHYAIAIHPTDEYRNAIIFDWLIPTTS